MAEKNRSIGIKSSEITPKQAYLSRRDFIKAAGVVAGSLTLASCAPASLQAASLPTPANPSLASKTDELGGQVNAFEDITGYNNYYEFTTDKAGVAPLAAKFKTTPWDVEVYGMVNKPKTYALEDLIRSREWERKGAILR